MKNILAKIRDWFKNLLDKVPHLSDEKMKLACYICGGLITASSIFFIYEMFTCEGFGIEANWNIFSSVFFGPLFFVGLVLAIANWGKFGHWGGKPYNVYSDGNGRERVEENNDIMDNTFYQILMPILGHFVIEPIIYACIIYYPLACVIAIFGVILPYAITIILLAICALLFVFNEHVMRLPYRTAILVLATILIAGGLTWAAVSMEQDKPKETTEYIEDIVDAIEETTDVI